MEAVTNLKKQELLLQFRTIITLLTLVKAPPHENDGPSILQLNSNHKLPALSEFEKAVQKALKAFVDVSTQDSEVLAAAGNINERTLRVDVARAEAAALPLVNAPKSSGRRKAKKIVYDQEVPIADITVYQGTVRYGVTLTPNPDDRDSYLKPLTEECAVEVPSGLSEWIAIKKVFGEVGKTKFFLNVQDRINDRRKLALEDYIATLCDFLTEYRVTKDFDHWTTFTWYMVIHCWPKMHHRIAHRSSVTFIKVLEGLTSQEVEHTCGIRQKNDWLYMPKRDAERRDGSLYFALRGIRNRSPGTLKSILDAYRRSVGEEGRQNIDSLMNALQVLNPDPEENSGTEGSEQRAHTGGSAQSLAYNTQTCIEFHQLYVGVLICYSEVLNKLFNIDSNNGELPKEDRRKATAGLLVEVHQYATLLSQITTSWVFQFHADVVSSALASRAPRHPMAKYSAWLKGQGNPKLQDAERKKGEQGNRLDDDNTGGDRDGDEVLGAGSDQKGESKDGDQKEEGEGEDGLGGDETPRLEENGVEEQLFGAEGSDQKGESKDGDQTEEGEGGDGLEGDETPCLEENDVEEQLFGAEGAATISAGFMSWASVNSSHFRALRVLTSYNTNIPEEVQVTLVATKKCKKIELNWVTTLTQLINTRTPHLDAKKMVDHIQDIIDTSPNRKSCRSFGQTPKEQESDPGPGCRTQKPECRAVGTVAFTAPYHCEGILAGLMQELKATTHKKPKGRSLNDTIKSLNPTIISVFKFCCPVCWELLQILRGNDKKYIIGGYHTSLIRVDLPPWLSIKVLEKMVDIFWEYLYDYFKTAEQDGKSDSELVASRFQAELTHSCGNSGQSYAVSESSRGSGPVDPDDMDLKAFTQP